MAGVRTTPPLVYLYAICGGLCGLAAMMQSSRLSAVDPNSGIGIELSAIAACVIGGTSLRGGQGSVLRTFIGVLIISILQTGLAQMGATEPLICSASGLLIDELLNPIEDFFVFGFAVHVVIKPLPGNPSAILIRSARKLLARFVARDSIFRSMHQQHRSLKFPCVIDGPLSSLEHR
jgi:branched-subunit amino acid ABC-type transport system permease component